MVSDAEKELQLQENLQNQEQNLVMLKNIFETESDAFLVFAIEYLQENLENMILHLSDPQKLEDLRQVFNSEQPSGSRHQVSNCLNHLLLSPKMR